MLHPAPLALLGLALLPACVAPQTAEQPTKASAHAGEAIHRKGDPAAPHASSAAAALEVDAEQVSSDSPDTQAAPRVSLPAGWETASLLAFEAELSSVPQRGEFDDASYQSLQRTLQDDADPTVSVRAALWLAAVDSERADRILLAQLQARRPHPERPADAADVVAAAHLARSSRAAELGVPAALAELADGALPHPDLEVRTECARGALLLGRTEVAPFLLRLTRLDTPLGRARDGAWHPVALTTWSRSRAAETLAEALGIPCPYRADASLADREAGALELEAAWTAAHPVRE